MLLRNTLFFKKKENLILFSTGLLTIIVAFYSAIGYPHSLAFLAVLLLMIVGIWSYKVFLGTILAIISFIPEGSFLLQFGLGLKLREEFTIHPIDFLFMFTIFIFTLRRLVLKNNNKLQYPSLISSIIMIFTLIAFVGFIRGTGVYGFKHAAWDACYSFFFLSFFVAYEMFSKNSRSLIITFKIILLALAIHSLLIVVLSFIQTTELIPEDVWLMWFSEGSQKFTGRVGFSNSSVFCVLIPLMLFFRDQILYHRILTKNQWCFVIICFLISTLIGMGRSLILLLALNIIILSVVRPQYSPRVIFMSIGSLIGISTLILIFPHLSDVLDTAVGRFADTEHLVQSFLGRYLSFQHAMDLFLVNPFIGTGFGSMMPLVWITGKIASEWLFIDNAFATILVKTGIVGGLPFFVLSLAPLGFLFTLIRSTSNKNKLILYKGLFWTYPSLWFSITMTSAHLIHSRVSIVFFSLFLAILAKEYMSIREIACQKT